MLGCDDAICTKATIYVLVSDIVTSERIGALQLCHHHRHGIIGVSLELLIDAAVAAAYRHGQTMVLLSSAPSNPFK